MFFPGRLVNLAFLGMGVFVSYLAAPLILLGLQLPRSTQSVSIVSIIKTRAFNAIRRAMEQKRGDVLGHDIIYRQ
ncbi:hypothetical protein HDK77DRAFT_265480 [Phyllosticta capitalensis]